MRRTFLMLLAAAAFTSGVRAAQFNAFVVTHNGGRYQVSADVYLAAPLPQVYQVLTDYDHLTRIGGLISESRILRQINAHTYLVYVESHGCVLFFCQTIRQTQQVTELTPRDVVAEAIPEESNVKMSSSSWHLDPQGRGTRMHWEVSMQPDFWVPPLIGPPMVEQALLSQGRSMAEGLEKLARERAHLPPLKSGSTHDPET
ncbi:MAG: SRPBCC family protein [Gammaproteobacteria bacterium]|nr:SRPBCC family protein [Gammaproteobacteria bacterium]